MIIIMIYIYIYIWVNYNDLTATSLEIMVNKGNHPQMALIQVSEFIIYPHIYIYIYLFKIPYIYICMYVCTFFCSEQEKPDSALHSLARQGGL